MKWNKGDLFMSTRSYICIEQEDGTYKGIYCHSDGYETHNGAILIDHYNSRERANALIKLGNLSYLQPKLEPDTNFPHSFDFDERQEGVTVAYGRDRGETEQESHAIMLEDLDKDVWIEYTYVFTKDDKWNYFEYGELKNGLKDLKQSLKKIFNNIGINRPIGEYGYFTESDISELKNNQNVEDNVNEL